MGLWVGSEQFLSLKKLIDMFAGQMTLSLPPYLIAKHNEESRKISLSVGDPAIAHQRAMWGENSTDP